MPCILSVILLHCILVFTQLLLKGSACFSNVNTLTISAWNFINDTFLPLVFSGLFHGRKGVIYEGDRQLL